MLFHAKWKSRFYQTTHHFKKTSNTPSLRDTYLLVVMLASSVLTAESLAGSVDDSSLVASVSVRFVLFTVDWRGRGIVFVFFSLSAASLIYRIHLQKQKEYMKYTALITQWMIKW